MRVDLESGIGVVAVTNARDGDPEGYVDEAMALLQRAAQRTDVEDAPRGDQHDPSAYEGRFKWEDWETWTVMLDGALYMVRPTDPSAAASLRMLTPVGDGVFSVEGGRGETLRVVLDQRGEPERLELANFHMIREPEVRATPP